MRLCWLGPGIEVSWVEGEVVGKVMLQCGNRLVLITSFGAFLSKAVLCT